MDNCSCAEYLGAQEQQVKLILALIAAAGLSGCADMTPEQRAEFGRNLAVGLAVGVGAGLAARPVYQPVYVAPVYVAPPRTTTCNRFGNQVTCNSW